MANQEELDGITDSTVRKLAAIVEHHNRNYQDQEKAALREEIDKLKKEMIMIDKTIKVRKDSNRVLTEKLFHVRNQYIIKVNTKDDQLKRLKSTADGSVKTKNETKMFHRNAMKDWEKKEEEYNRDIEKMSSYIDGLHSTLQRHGITIDRCLQMSDEYESDEFEVDWNEYLYRPEQYESDTQFDDDEN